MQNEKTPVLKPETETRRPEVILRELEDALIDRELNPGIWLLHHVGLHFKDNAGTPAIKQSLNVAMLCTEVDVFAASVKDVLLKVAEPNEGDVVSSPEFQHLVD